MATADAKCIVCQKSTTRVCSDCALTPYCSDECQRKNFARHERLCPKIAEFAIALIEEASAPPEPSTEVGGNKGKKKGPPSKRRRVHEQAAQIPQQELQAMQPLLQRPMYMQQMLAILSAQHPGLGTGSAMRDVPTWVLRDIIQLASLDQRMHCVEISTGYSDHQHIVKSFEDPFLRTVQIYDVPDVMGSIARYCPFENVHIGIGRVPERNEFYYSVSFFRPENAQLLFNINNMRPENPMEDMKGVVKAIDNHVVIRLQPTGITIFKRDAVDAGSAGVLLLPGRVEKAHVIRDMALIRCRSRGFYKQFCFVRPRDLQKAIVPDEVARQTDSVFVYEKGSALIFHGIGNKVTVIYVIDPFAHRYETVEYELRAKEGTPQYLREGIFVFTLDAGERSTVEICAVPGLSARPPGAVPGAAPFVITAKTVNLKMEPWSSEEKIKKILPNVVAFWNEKPRKSGEVTFSWISRDDAGNVAVATTNLLVPRYWFRVIGMSASKRLVCIQGALSETIEEFHYRQVARAFFVNVDTGKILFTADLSGTRTFPSNYRLVPILENIS